MAGSSWPDAGRRGRPDRRARERGVHLRHEHVGLRHRQAAGDACRAARLPRRGARRRVARLARLGPRRPRRRRRSRDGRFAQSLSRPYRDGGQCPVGAAHPRAVARDLRLCRLHASLTMTPPLLLHATTGPLWADWDLEPGIVLPLAIAAVLYARGLRLLWDEHVGRGIRLWEASAFGAGLI